MDVLTARVLFVPKESKSILLHWPRDCSMLSLAAKALKKKSGRCSLPFSRGPCRMTQSNSTFIKGFKGKNMFILFNLCADSVWEAKCHSGGFQTAKDGGGYYTSDIIWQHRILQRSSAGKIKTPHVWEISTMCWRIIYVLQIANMLLSRWRGSLSGEECKGGMTKKMHGNHGYFLQKLKNDTNYYYYLFLLCFHLKASFILLIWLMLLLIIIIK